jgi:hypothetical protein
MLLIVINHKKPEQKQPGQKTADNPAGQMEIPERPRNGARQKKRRRENAPPTPRRGIRRELSGCQYEFFSRSHLHFNFLMLSQILFLSMMILPASTLKTSITQKSFDFRHHDVEAIVEPNPVFVHDDFARVNAEDLPHAKVIRLPTSRC